MKYCISTRKKCSPDVLFYSVAKREKESVYVVNPLLVDHKKGTYSNTYGKARNELIRKNSENWMGNRDVMKMLGLNEKRSGYEGRKIKPMRKKGGSGGGNKVLHKA